MTDPGKLAAADQYSAVANEMLNETLELVRSGMAQVPDRARAIVAVKGQLKTAPREHLETLLAVALIRLAEPQR